MQNLNLQQFEEELGKNFWPVLRSAKKRVEVEDWGQVGEVLEMKTLRKKSSSRYVFLKFILLKMKHSDGSCFKIVFMLL